MRHLLTLKDLTTAEIEHLFELSTDLKVKLQQGEREPILAGYVLGLLFEKPSLRTRCSFEAAMTHLGGNSIFLGQEAGWGKRESPRDFSQVFSQYVDAIACRSFEAEKVEELAHYSRVPVINALTDSAHPCQALADLFTLQESRGSLEGATLAYVGDGNNVATSLAWTCAKLNVRFTAATPVGYELPEDVLQSIRDDVPQANIEVSHDPAAMVAQADAIYTDVWASMGQEDQTEQRKKDFAPYQVNEALMQAAPKEAIFLHCLPAHRGDEVTNEVIDSQQSRVIPQAANRMHVQKAILAWLLAGR